MLNRRRMMMLLPSDTFPPYKLKNGTAVVGNKTVTIKYGVIAISTSSADAYWDYAYINVSDLSQNGDDPFSKSNVTNKPTIFTIPAGAVCVLKIHALYPLQASGEHARLKMFEAESENEIATTPHKYTWVGSGEWIDTVDWTQGNDVNVGSLCIYFQNMRAQMKSATISLTVNGEKWV